MDSLIIQLIIMLLVAGVAIWVVGMIPLPHPFGLIVRVLIAVLVLLWLLRLLGVFSGGGTNLGMLEPFLALA